MNIAVRCFKSFPLLLSAVLITSASAADPAQAKRARSAANSAKASDPADSVPPELRSPARVVSYGEKDVVSVKTKIRYTTLLVLPKGERILDFTCGDKDFWAIDGNENLAYVKPAKEGAETNLNLIAASGNIYSFILEEVSQLPDARPDLKVFVEPNEEAMAGAAVSAPRFVSAEQLEDYRRQVEIAKEETRQAKQAAQDAIDSGITTFISNVRFPYRFEAGKKPFFVRAMYHDDKFTYIQARPEETPALYEIKDGKPNLVNFNYKDGVYVVDKILNQGYLAVGKRKLAFKAEE